MIKTVTLDRNQKPTKEQIRQIEEAAKKKLYLMKILPNLPLQWKKHFVQRQKTATPKEKQTFPNYVLSSIV